MNVAAVQTSGPAVAPVASSPAAPAAAPTPGANADFTKVVGTIRSSPVEEQHFHLVFGDPRGEHGGEFCLGFSDAMRSANLVDGDLVAVTGTPDPDAITFTMDGESYDVDTITRIG